MFFHNFKLNSNSSDEQLHKLKCGTQVNLHFDYHKVASCFKGIKVAISLDKAIPIHVLPSSPFPLDPLGARHLLKA